MLCRDVLQLLNTTNIGILQATMNNSNIHTAQRDIKVITIYNHEIVYLGKVARINLNCNCLILNSCNYLMFNS